MEPGRQERARETTRRGRSRREVGVPGGEVERERWWMAGREGSRPTRRKVRETRPRVETAGTWSWVGD